MVNYYKFLCTSDALSGRIYADGSGSDASNAFDNLGTVQIKSFPFPNNNVNYCLQYIHDEWFPDQTRPPAVSNPQTYTPTATRGYVEIVGNNSYFRARNDKLLLATSGISYPNWSYVQGRRRQATNPFYLNDFSERRNPFYQRKSGL